MYPWGQMPLALERPARVLTALLALAVVGACASKTPSSAGSTASRGMYKVGAPYKIDGITYTPVEQFQHVETGMASWYGPGFHGKSTANGETYDQHDRTAAHRTLQMPSVLRVTNLENGQSTVVRVNDRGPFARSRVIDLSKVAAEELDMTRAGTARVRIEQLEAESQAVKQIALSGGGPNEQRAAIAAGRRGSPPAAMTAQAPPSPPPPAAAPPSSPPIAPPVTPAVIVYPSAGAPTVASLATASTSVQPASTISGSSGFYVQTGAFSTAGNAEKQRGMIASYGASEISQGSSGGREVYRVRLGPYTTQEAAGIVADRLKRSGYGDARVVAD